MTGSWRVLERGARWPRSPRAAWLYARRGEREVVQFNGPVLELMTESRSRFDRRLAAARARTSSRRSSTRPRFLRRLREDDPTRPIGDALLDQRTIAGIGNLWKVEGCFVAAHRPLAARPGEVSDDEVRAIVAATRPRMQRVGARTATRPAPSPSTAGPACRARAAATPIRLRGQGDDNRPTFWCPSCQA